MPTTFNSYVAAAKQRREDGEKGFSLIELIVVVVILGILAAVAIPIFLGIQTTAKDNALKAVAGTAASATAADIASTPQSGALGPIDTDVYKTDANATVVVSGAYTLNGFCVTASPAGSTVGATGPQKAGPGC